ncbi:DUF3048 C-terminal domain-containing protein [Thermocatellispora tengchongensis]|uniref:DUF3048 C-terminal domain-containing protein n=1 Tax=Thermocatellispora tengchongensis TaxID=1073253 RepID=UPI003638DF44
MPRRPLHLRLVGDAEALADLAGRQARHGGRGRPARRPHHRRPVRQDHPLPVPRRQRQLHPLIKTTGTGRAVVLRDGKAYKAKWSRPSEKEGTTFTTESGDPMPFAKGQVWVVLAAPKPVQP